MCKTYDLNLKQRHFQLSLLFHEKIDTGTVTVIIPEILIFGLWTTVLLKILILVKFPF